MQGGRLSVDGTVIAVNASDKRRIARQQIPEAAQVSRTLREYLAEVEAANPVQSEGSKTTDGDATISLSDPDATWATKGGIPVQFCYYDNYLIDKTSIIPENGLGKQAFVNTVGGSWDCRDIAFSGCTGRLVRRAYS